VGFIIQGVSLARTGKHLSKYTVEQRLFLFRKYWQTGFFKAWQTAFRTEYFERHAPLNCCIQKFGKNLETREADLTPADFFLWGLLKGKVYKTTPRTKCTKLHPTQSVQSYTPHKECKTKPHTNCTKLHPAQIVQNYTRTIENHKEAICLDIQVVNLNNLGKVFQNLEKRTQVCLDVEGY